MEQHVDQSRDFIAEVRMSQGPPSNNRGVLYNGRVLCEGVFCAVERAVVCSHR